MQGDVEARVLDLLAQSGPLKARDIAKRLGVDLTVVNQILYHRLGDRVRQDQTYTWSLSGEYVKPSAAVGSVPPHHSAASVRDDPGPMCPACGSPMVLRTARQGANAGNQFWGCKTFPACRGTLDLADEQGTQRDNFSRSDAATLATAVQWRDRRGRSHWAAEYVPVGAATTLFDRELAEPTVTRLLSQTLLLQARKRETAQLEEHSAGLLAVAEKILLRGRAPLPSIAVEREALLANELGSLAEPLDEDDADLGWVWRGASPKWSDEALFARTAFYPCSELLVMPGGDGALVDSSYERQLLEIAADVDETLPHWLIPQASLRNLLIDPTDNDGDDRRVDFVLHHPRLAKPIVIELDGPEHVAEVDAERDRQLAASGCETIRIPNSEIEVGRGPSLDRLRGVLQSLAPRAHDSSETSWRASRFALECAWGAKLQFAIVRAMQSGLLTPTAEHWRIQIDTPFPSSVAAVQDLLNLVGAIEQLYEGWLLPGAVYVDSAGSLAAFMRSEDGWHQSHPASVPDEEFDLRVRLEPHGSPWAAYPDEPFDIVVRPAYAPRDFAPGHAAGNQASLVSRVGIEAAHAPLTQLLQTVFRKRSFREGQAEAVYNAVTGNDSIVLLPTGGGKSIIYQLSGLLSPGITLVIDPLVALIEDQIRVLRSYGIDRAVGISSATGSGDERLRLQRAAERGEYMFMLVAPERMQSPNFRATLRTVAVASRINLAVIDEAHCVSEWGHDFRPAYLNLSRNLRRLAQGNGVPPTILALTGTASRAVLRDMVADLELDSKAKSSIVRPASFDRKELRFRIVETDGRNAQADLRGVLMALPRDFQRTPADFYTPAGRHTFSGIVFTSFAKSRVGGVLDLRDQVKQATGAPVTIYAGGAPHAGIDKRAWDEEKRANAKRFMQNEAAVLVATKAFGMGIDKANIRYTLHFGMPGSLEAFYQEAGRAGRDRRPAQCVVLYSRPEPQIESKLDVIRSSLDELRSAFEAAPRNGRGDLGSALFFHLNSFAGSDEELGDVRSMVARLSSLQPGESIELPFARARERFKQEDVRKREEKALFRLVQVGYLADYELDWGSQKIRVVGGSKDPETVAARVIDYVKRSDSGRVKDVQGQLARIVKSDQGDEATIRLIGILVAFCYDTIERARRRSIFEAMEAAKQGRDAENFRRRLLDYLQEGMDPDSFQRLVEAPTIDFACCKDMLAKTNNDVEAGELRGITIRFLESYPDHPVLLALRAMSESLSPDCDDNVVLDSLRTLLTESAQKYTVDGKTMDTAIALIAQTAEARTPRLFPALLLAMEDTGYASLDPDLGLNSLARRGFAVAPDDVGDLALLGRLKRSIASLRAAASNLAA